MVLVWCLPWGAAACCAVGWLAYLHTSVLGVLNHRHGLGCNLLMHSYGYCVC